MNTFDMPGLPPSTPESRARHAAYMERMRVEGEAERARIRVSDLATLAELRSLIGQPLTAVTIGRRDEHNRAPETVRLTFADGRTVEIDGFGYDEWGISVDITDTPDGDFTPVEP